MQILIKIPMWFFNQKKEVKFIETWIKTYFVKRKNNAVGLGLPHILKHIKAAIIKAECYWKITREVN